MQRGIMSVAPTNPNAKLLAHAARYLLNAKGDRFMAAEHAQSAGALPRIVQILKDTPIGVTGDSDFGSVLADSKIASSAFIESLAGASILPTMFSDGALTRVPLGQRLGSVIAGSVGGIIDEGQTVSGSSLQLSGQTVPLLKAQSIIVISSEVAALQTPAAAALIDGELRKAVTAVVDQKYSDIAMVGAPGLPSTGVFADDVEALLGEVSLPGSRLYFAMPAGVAGKMALADKHGTMTPQGGAYLGVPAIVSATVPDGTLRLFDAKGFAGDIEGVVLGTATQATLDLGVPADSPPTAATVPISLWQSNLAAVKATVFFGIKKLRTAAAAEVTGIGSVSG